MATLVEVLSYVSHTKWPYGMNHIKEVEQLIPGWTALKNLDWKWFDCVPFDFYMMKREVQNLFVRDIILLQVSESRLEVRKLEQLIRERENENMDRWEKYYLAKDFIRWHAEIDDFQEYFMVKYSERMEAINSTLNSWPEKRVHSFMR